MTQPHQVAQPLYDKSHMKGSGHGREVWGEFLWLSPLWPRLGAVTSHPSSCPMRTSTVPLLPPAPYYSMVNFGRWWKLFHQTDPLSRFKKWQISSLGVEDFWNINSYTFFVQHSHSKCNIFHDSLLRQSRKNLNLCCRSATIPLSSLGSQGENMKWYIGDGWCLE